jgi:aminoglycoside phosphotransferase (APT) family kinase protein
MQIEALKQRLLPFCEARYDSVVRVFDVVPMPGHAGFAYGFRVAHGLGVDSWFIRLPPPNVNWVGTADVLRQVTVLDALEGTAVPHCSVRWSGDDLEWFGCPYFVVPWLEGDVVRLGPVDSGGQWGDSQLLRIGRQAMAALAGVHGLDTDKVDYLGAPVLATEDVTRWDRLYERAANADALGGVPACRQKLLDQIPGDPLIGVFHGDFQCGNLFVSGEADLLAVIDWELTGVGAVLNDLGWICTFCDRKAWFDGDSRPMFLDPATLTQFYEDARGEPVEGLDWYRALAAYKFAIITGFNLDLHQRGKRVDPSWEHTAASMRPLIDRALELLG